jgi:site-specific DNA recombinase
MFFNERKYKRYKPQIEINKNDAIGYTRIDDIFHLDNVDIPIQNIKIKEYCEKNNLNLLKIYCDGNKSGFTTDERNEFLDLIKNIKPGNVIIVHRLSILSRIQIDILNFYKDMVNNKFCTFICLSPYLDSRESGTQFMIGMYSSIIQYENKSIEDEPEYSCPCCQSKIKIRDLQAYQG